MPATGDVPTECRRAVELSHAKFHYSYTRTSTSVVVPYTAGMCQPAIPALWRYPSLLRMPTLQRATGNIAVTVKAISKAL